jgi:catechol 2,3-dioxygenase-like lactoylglutathione lyase family enzyme
MSTLSQTIPTQGLHHITLTGAGRQITLDFWEGILGMPFVFEQPNLDNPDESHLYFDPGDDRLITVFCDETPGTSAGQNPDCARCRASHCFFGQPSGVDTFAGKTGCAWDRTFGFERSGVYELNLFSRAPWGC